MRNRLLVQKPPPPSGQPVWEESVFSSGRLSLAAALVPRSALARRAKDRRLRGKQYAPRLLPHDQQLKQKCDAKADLEQDLLRNPAGIG